MLWFKWVDILRAAHRKSSAWHCILCPREFGVRINHNRGQGNLTLVFKNQDLIAVWTAHYGKKMHLLNHWNYVSSWRAQSPLLMSFWAYQHEIKIREENVDLVLSNKHGRIIVTKGYITCWGRRVAVIMWLINLICGDGDTGMSLMHNIYYWPMNMIIKNTPLHVAFPVSSTARFWS